MKKYLNSFKTGFQKFSHLVADLVNLVLLGLVYFIGIGLTSIIAKLSKKHFLDLKQEGKDTCWVDVKSDSQDIDDYYKMF